MAPTWDVPVLFLCVKVPLFVVAVMYAYEQCLLVFGHHPDVWCEACVWLEHVSRILQQKGDAANSKLFQDSVALLFERAVSQLMKHNHLMYFAYADYEEVRCLMLGVVSVG